MYTVRIKMDFKKYLTTNVHIDGFSATICENIYVNDDGNVIDCVLHISHLRGYGVWVMVYMCAIQRDGYTI